ncbi:MAG: WhiB family transcriptional regulator [Rhodococcus sp.]|nr:WhiB family transcriptional regulator [Rhodococcus sp. (in: high G+C Gram-positive bacteria)]
MNDDWLTLAACRGMDSAIFFPEEGRPADPRARQTCAICPVSDNCMNAALDNSERFGIWAGTSHEDRQPLRTARSTRQAEAQCGTDSGYYRHRRTVNPATGERGKPCDACKSAHTKAQRDRDVARRMANAAAA